MERGAGGLLEITSLSTVTTAWLSSRVTQMGGEPFLSVRKIQETRIYLESKNAEGISVWFHVSEFDTSSCARHSNLCSYEK